MSNHLVVRVEDLGLCDYQTAFERQQKLQTAVANETSDPTIILVVHPPTLTLGKNANRSHLFFTPEQYHDMGVELIESDRGGEVTAHEPGQLTVYPILPLARWNITVRKYICMLEKAVIAVLGKWNIEANTDSEHPGVWVGSDKVCAVGVRIKNRISMHGIALNIVNDMKTFDTITPCGIQGRGVTSMRKLGIKTDMAEVKSLFLSEFTAQLQKCKAFQDIKPDLQWNAETPSMTSIQSTTVAGESTVG